MQSWLPDMATMTGPKYLAIVAALEQAIRIGVLRPGERLPPQRDLARHLGIDLTTVTRAYGIARDSGLIEGVGKLGSFVRNSAGHAAGTASESSGMILPPQPAFGLLGDAMRQGLGRLLRAGGSSPLLQYQPPGGGVHDRIQAAACFRDLGIPTTDAQVMIAAGGQNALQAIAATVVQPGDALCLGASVYPGMLTIAARLRLRLRPMAGFDADAFERAARDGAKALYIVPTNDNPTTLTLDIEQRQAVARIARRHDLQIIEDDAYGRLPAAPLPPIAYYAPERTWHVASMAKILSPVLRVAHVRLPDGVAPAPFAAMLAESAVMAPPLNAALVTAWMRDGSFGRLVDAVRAEGMARQHIAARRLAGLDYAAHPEGYHVWLRTGVGIAPADLAAAIRPAGLSIVPGEAFAAEPARPERAVRISIGGAIDHVRLDMALARVNTLAAARP